MQLYRQHVKSPKEDAETYFFLSLKDICFSIDFFHPGPSKCLGFENSNARCLISHTIIWKLGYVLAIPQSITHLHELSYVFNKNGNSKMKNSVKVFCAICTMHS